jgi:hypothetical protein
MLSGYDVSSLVCSYLEHILMREVVGGCLQDMVINCYDADVLVIMNTMCYLCLG